MKADLDLVDQAKRGDQMAFSELVRRHQKTLYRVLWKFTRDQILAEDMMQEAFVKAYQKISTFEGRSSFRSWLIRIGINTATNALRARKKHHSIDEVHASGPGEMERSLIYKDLQKLIQEELLRLPDRQRMALSLRIFEDLGFQEIAVLMECPYDTAKANYRHGLLKMKASLGRLDWVKNINELEDDRVIKLKEYILEVEG